MTFASSFRKVQKILKRFIVISSYSRVIEDWVGRNKKKSAQSILGNLKFIKSLLVSLCLFLLSLSLDSSFQSFNHSMDLL